MILGVVIACCCLAHFSVQNWNKVNTSTLCVDWCSAHWAGGELLLGTTLIAVSGRQQHTGGAIYHSCCSSSDSDFW